LVGKFAEGKDLEYNKCSWVNSLGNGKGGLNSDLLIGINLVRPMTLTFWRSGWSDGNTVGVREGGRDGTLEVETVPDGEGFLEMLEVEETFCLEEKLDLELVLDLFL